jgi:hypothetical protein
LIIFNRTISAESKANNWSPDTMDDTDFEPSIKRFKRNKSEGKVEIFDKLFFEPTHQTALKEMNEIGHQSSRNTMNVMLQRNLDSTSQLHELCRRTMASLSHPQVSNDPMISFRSVLDSGVRVVPTPCLTAPFQQRRLSLETTMLPGQWPLAHWDSHSLSTYSAWGSASGSLDVHTGAAQENSLDGPLLQPLISLGNTTDSSLSRERASSVLDLSRNAPLVRDVALPCDQRPENRVQAVDAGGLASTTTALRVDRASVTGSLDAPSYSKVILMSVDSDSYVLSEYQCLLRQQVEFFEACTADLRARAQGRNKPIYLKQVFVSIILLLMPRLKKT